jgi:hypothetical protein
LSNLRKALQSPTCKSVEAALHQAYILTDEAFIREHKGGIIPDKSLDVVLLSKSSNASLLHCFTNQIDLQAIVNQFKYQIDFNLVE